MLMKESLLLVVTIILLNCKQNECRTIQCYSCSDCGNATLSRSNTILTTNDDDQCMSTKISIGMNPAGGQLVYRGASSNCRPYTSEKISVFCCRSDFCNA